MSWRAGFVAEPRRRTVDKQGTQDKAARSVPWTFLTYGVNKILMLAITVVLSRLLVPTDFGILALAVLLNGFVGIAGDLGLGAALVLRQDLDRRAQGTVFTATVASWTAIAALATAASPLLADLFAEPRLAPVLPALAWSAVISSVGWFYESVLQRELEFRRRFLAVTLQALAYGAVGIACAVAGAGVWSLVAAQVASALAYSASLAWLAPYRVRPRFDLEVALSVFRSGRGFIVQGGAAFLQQSLDTLVVGRALGTAQLGFYSMAYRLGDLAYSGLADPVARVTFPAFARMRNRGEDVRPAFLSAMSLVALVAFLAATVLSAAADPFTRLVFGRQWLPMIEPLAILGAWAGLRAVEGTLGWLLNSIGEAGRLGASTTLLLLAQLPALVAGAVWGGITGVAWVMLGHMVILSALLALIVSQRASISLAMQWRAVRPAIAAFPVAWGAVHLALWSTAEQVDAVRLPIGVLTAIAVYLPVVTLVEPGLPRRAYFQIRRAFGRGSAQPRAT